MSKLLETIKEQRIASMKSGDKSTRYALEAVINEVTQKVGRKEVLDDSLVIKVIKSEISKYNEMGRVLEVNLLTEYLPKQMTKEQLGHFVVNLYEEGDNVSHLIKKLDEKGFKDQYDKGTLAIIIKNIK